MKHLEQALHSVYALQYQVNVDNMYKILQLIQSLLNSLNAILFLPFIRL